MDNALRNGITAIVEYDYTAKEPDELNLEKGVILHSIKIQPGGWWEGTLASTGKTGMFPDNFVRVLEPDDKNPVVLRDKSATVNRRCKAVYSYSQNNNDELTLAVGDVIEFLGEVEEGWWRGKLGENIGVFPSNFVITIDNVSPILANRRTTSGINSASRLRNNLTSSREDLVLSSNTQSFHLEKDAPSLPPKPVRELCKVLYPYQPTNEDELELKDGDVITVLTKDLPDKGWWKGELRGKVGVFPDNFVVAISQETSPLKESHKPDRPPATSKVLINSKSPSNRKDSFGSKDSLNDSGIMTGNVAAYRKSLENRSNDHTPVASTTTNNEKPSHRKTFDAKLSSDFRKSLESLDEKKTTPPPVLSKKPVVPIKKSPTVGSVAGNIFSGLKQIVKSDKHASNDSLDGIGNSKSASVSQIADMSEKGVIIERIKKDDTDFDNVERSSILQDMRASRVKAPKRRLPTSSMSFGSSIDNNNSTTYQNGGGGNNGFIEPLFDGKTSIIGLPPPASSSSAAATTSDDDTAKPKARNWEKQKAPWMDELKASQAKKTSPSIGETKSPEIPITQKSHSIEHHQHHHHHQQHQQHHETVEKFDMSKSFSSSYVSSSASILSSSSHNKKSIDSSAMESLRSGSVDATKPIPSSIDMTTSHHSRKLDGDLPQNIMTKSMSVIASKSNDIQSSSISTVTPIDDTTNNVKIRPSSVNLKNRSVSPVARIMHPSASTTATTSSPEVMCLRVSELEQKVAKLEAIVTVQSKTIEELVRSVKEESETVKQLRSELDKYAQCVTQEYPILGVPFTVKESCSLKGLSHCVGSLARQNIKAKEDGLAVSYLRAAGGIPLLVSTTPEYCQSWESNNLVTGKTLNPHDLRRTSGGSSGGEGALIGAGASLFGVGSDIAGSIRVPAMFNGIFGHKPTAGIVSLNVHFPNSTNEQFQQYLVIDPMARYAKDLPTLLYIMAGENATKLKLEESLFTKDIQIFYMEDSGFSFSDIPVDNEIKLCMWKAIQHFKNNKLVIKQAPIDSLQEATEISLGLLFNCHLPIMLEHSKRKDNIYLELLKSIIGQSNYSYNSLFSSLLIHVNGFIPRKKIPLYREMGDALKEKLLKMLGTDSVLFYPTFPIPAMRLGDSPTKLNGVIYTALFNWLGFPSTHVPLGKNSSGLPIGIQVVAAPYQDRLCLCIAGELEAAFGGWTKPF